MKRKQFIKGLQIAEITSSIIKTINTKCNKCSDNRGCLLKGLMIHVGAKIMEDYIESL